MSLWSAITAVGLALLVLPANVHAHAYLESSDPSPNGNVVEGKTVLALRFSEVIDPSHTRVRLSGPGAADVPTRLDRPADRLRVMRVEVPPLEPGVYELGWSSFSVDGHVDRGSFKFTVADAPLLFEGPVQAHDPDAQDPRLVALEVVGRLAFLLGALIAFGLPIYLSEIEPRGVLPAGSGHVLVAAGLAGTLGAVMLLAILTERLDVGARTALLTLPGLFLLGKLGLMTLIAGVAYRARHLSHELQRPRLLAGVGAATLALVLHSVGGHGVLAMTSKESAAGHVAMTIHLVCAGVWLGGVVGLTLAAREGHALVERVRAFTPLAIASVAALVVTGVVQAYVHLPTPDALWTSTFGLLLIAKTALLGIALLFGAWHGFFLPRQIAGGRRTAGTFARSGTSEVVVLGAILLVAASMGASPVPDTGIDVWNRPLAVVEASASLPDHRLRVRVLADPVRARSPVPIQVELSATSSIGVDDAHISARLAKPGRADLALHTESGEADRHERRWRFQPVEFAESGLWTLRLELAISGERYTEEVPVVVLPATPGSDAHGARAAVP